MVGAFAHNYLRHQPRSGQRPWNSLGRLASHRHVLLRKRRTAFQQRNLAGVFLANMHDHKQGRGTPVELLATLRRQFHQILRSAHGRHLGLRQVVDALFTLDLLGNPPTTVPVALLGDRR